MNFLIVKRTWWPVPGNGARWLVTAVALLSLAWLTGCAGTVPPAERKAQEQLAEVTRRYRPHGHTPFLPVLTTNATLGDLLTYALLNHPQVAATYYDWQASVHDITVARSLPDPQVTFQTDIADAVTSVMPGLVQTLPGWGKLKAQAGAAAAGSAAKAVAYQTAVLQTAYGVKQSYYQLWYLEETLGLDREMQRLLVRLEHIARAQNESGQVT